ncbi:hypothetical protein [Paeniglutamicibacter kerguelensis]|uniref:Uncharacterized protein n=1 Tax=Paeniglutamicibacter kerguelensis TaxID=254788 RepID=A0ABS4X9C2_9MICC|nr:hypothetical protein [Paeniglutamicibacter kerguelensis]MBP2385057.1 hypothetical protein [Paeniglutamicibacter kerguelensis]
MSTSALPEFTVTSPEGAAATATAGVAGPGTARPLRSTPDARIDSNHG